MTKMPHPFSLPAKLDPDLKRVHQYWGGLKRGENKVPFADDVNLSALSGLKERVVLIDVFEQPQRFRFNAVGSEIRAGYGADVVGKFADEIEGKGPLQFLSAQASATVEACAPTYHRNGFARLLLPMWGDGHVALLFGAAVRA
jgi:hypothetical protein